MDTDAGVRVPEPRLAARVQLALSGFSQVIFVAANTIFISKGVVVPMVLTSFAISLIWTFNVKRISIGDWNDRIYYSVGACAGCGSGYFLAEKVSGMLVGV